MRLFPVLCVLVLTLLPTMADAQQCYKANSIDLLSHSNPYNASFIFDLSPTSCSVTPTSHGWLQVTEFTPPPYDLHVAVRYDAGLTNCYLPFYFGEGSNGPIVPIHLIPSLPCDSYPLSSTPPACTPFNHVGLSGPTSTYLYHSHPFTASPSGGQGPYTYRWSIRFHNATYNTWSSWSSFNGSQTQTASSSSCGNDKYQIRVEVTESSCGLKRTSATKTVQVINYACPW